MGAIALEIRGKSRFIATGCSTNFEGFFHHGFTNALTVAVSLDNYSTRKANLKLLRLLGKGGAPSISECSESTSASLKA